MLKDRRLLVAIALVALLVLISVRFIGPRMHVLVPPRAANSAQYMLYVHVPERCRSAPCPALYILDGGRWLGTFTQLTEELAARHAMAPIILVGVGYPAIPGFSGQRQRDFTSGAGAYLSALKRDIIPFAQSHLPIDTNWRGIVAYKDAAALAAYALAHAPDAFDAYLIVSPSTAPSALFTGSQKPHTVALAGAFSDMQRMRQLGGVLLSDPNMNVSQSLYPNKAGDAIVEPAARAALPTLFPDP
jgi:hypothetical protein